MRIRTGLSCGVLAAVSLAAGCGAPPRRAVGDPDPAAKIPGIKDAVAARDAANFGQLVTDLESDDPAVRFYAIEALERLTGESHGYSYYADEDARKSAARKWRTWLAQRSAQPSGPATRTE